MKAASIVRLASLCLFAILAGGCGSPKTGSGRPGFEVASVPICQSETRFVAVKTQFGGVMRLDILDRCGNVLTGCEAPDQLAPRAVTGFRTAGVEVLTGGCALEVEGAARVRVTFDGGDLPEIYEAPFAGVCVELAACMERGALDASVPDARRGGG